MTPIPGVIQFPDLSHYEPDVQFGEMLAGGVPLFITKATQGSSMIDPTFADFCARGRAVGHIVGAYTFINPSDPAPQVNEFLYAANLQSGDLQPIVDAEAAGLSQAQTFGAMEAFEAAGYAPILYCSLSFFGDVLGSPTTWPLWLAAYRSQLPSLPSGVTLFAWQHTDSGDCPGVSKPCDMNYFYGTLDDLSGYCLP